MDLTAVRSLPLHTKTTDKLWKIMRLIAVFLLAASLHVSATGNAQQVSLSEKNAKLEKIFRELKKQTGYDFFYNMRAMEIAIPVTINVKNVTLSQALDICFAGQPLSYSIEDKMVVIKERPAVTLSEVEGQPAPLSVVEVDVRGRVLNEAGEPVVGASVKIKGTDKGTTTNANGEFTLTSIPESSTLLISATNIQPLELKTSTILSLMAANSGIAIITARIKISSLNEVIINKGYYNEKRGTSTGSVSSITSKDISTQPIANPLQAMQARMPGVFIIQNTGMPGGSYTIRIRGQNSIVNGNEPFYIIDGVPYTQQLLLNANPAREGNNNGGNPLNFINPSDIESIDVLKDADATAIYGSRGANGVVLITTKKGKTGRMKVDASVYSGTGKVSRKLDLLNTQQYIAMRIEGIKNDGLGAFLTPQFASSFPDILMWDTTRYTDWQRELLGGTANFTNAQASISGGASNIQYLFGGGYYKESTVFPNGGQDQKASVHFNITNTSTNQKFRAIFSGNYAADNNNLINQDLTRYIKSLPPNTPTIYNSDGSLNWANGSWTNPFSYLLKKYKARTNNLVTNAVLSYSLLKDLDIKTNLGYTNMQSSEISTNPIASQNPSSSPTGGSSFINNNIRSWIVEPQISYKKTFNKNKIEALVGTTFQQNINEGQYLGASGYTSDVLLENIKAAPSISVASVISNIYKYNAVFGRIGFNSSDKYLLNITMRRDGTSRFGPERQFHNFGAIGGAWVFSKESFLQKNMGFLSYGKLRGSYGTTGNDQVGDYRYMDLFNNTPYSYQGIVGMNPAGLFNPELAWEETKKIEGAIDLGFFNDRILLSASYFRNRSSNQLVNYTLSAVTGFTSVSKNLPALVQNTGWELLLNSNNIQTTNFKWSSTINFTIPKNKLIDYPDLAISSSRNLLVIGQPITITKVFHSLGVDPQTGLYIFANNQGNPTANPSFLNDRTLLINTAPKYYGGFQNHIEYKGFQLDVLFQFVKQIGPNNLFSSFRQPGAFPFNQTTEVMNRWRKAGDVSNVQQFSQGFGNAYTAYTNAQSSDLAYSDASFIRLKNLSISYQLPKNWHQKLHLQNCQIYVQGQNLLTITKYKGLDPENVSSTALPPLRVIAFGIRIGF